MLRPEPRPRALAVERDHHARAAPALHQPRRHDPDHARVPALARHHDRGLVRLRRRRRPRRRTGCGSRPPGGRGSGGRARAPPRSARASSSVSSSSSAASARCMRPAALMRGPSRKPSECSESSPGATPPTSISARRPGFRVRAQRHEALAHDAAVLAAQRHEVADRGERGQVDVLGGLAGSRPAAAYERLAQLQRDARGAQLRAAVVARAPGGRRCSRAAPRPDGGGR